MTITFGPKKSAKELEALQKTGQAYCDRVSLYRYAVKDKFEVCETVQIITGLASSLTATNACDLKRLRPSACTIHCYLSKRLLFREHPEHITFYKKICDY